MKQWFVAALALVLAGCGGQWVKVGDSKAQNVTGDAYSISLPLNWVKREFGGELIVSKDGPDLQQIVVRAAAHDKAFPNIEQSSAADMLPTELSAKYVANLKASDEDGLPSLKVERDEPVTLDGQQGFFLELTYATGTGVRYRTQVYGVANDKGLVTVAYDAAEIYFFERDMDPFQSALTSVKLL